jgi:hypothetical protein
VSIAAASLLLCLSDEIGKAQQPDEATVIRGVDAAVSRRFENVLGFTDIEHYAVYRDKDEAHSIAEMTVRDTYGKGSAKTYTILSESGSELVRKLGLHLLIDNETTLNQPGNVKESWIDSANYEMRLKSGEAQKLNGRSCYVLVIHPRRRAANMVDGLLWVDAKDYSIVKLDGTASRSPSLFAGETHMMREYINIEGFSMAAQARAETKGILGKIAVTIEYTNYHLELSGRE